MKKWLLVLLLGVAGSMAAQQPVIHLWNGKAPGSEKWTSPETLSPDGKFISNVSDPTLTVYLPDPSKATGAAFVVCPGGGMRVLGWENEGIKTAQWLNQRGIAAFILKYRTFPENMAQPRPSAGGPPSGPRVLPEIRNGNANPDPTNEALNAVVRMAISDAQQALRLVRSRAAEWHVDPHRVGIVGYSAGSGVSIGTALGEKNEAYPDLLVALHGPSLVDVSVPSYAAPAFISVGKGHPNVLQGSIALFSLWRAANRPAEFHVYDIPVAVAGDGDAWRSLEEWLRSRGFLARAETAK